MTSYRVATPRKKTTTLKTQNPGKKRWSRTSEKSKTTWADPTIPITKISKSKVTKKQVPQLSCWSFG
jgi:hypothetical protein